MRSNRNASDIERKTRSRKKERKREGGGRRERERERERERVRRRGRDRERERERERKRRREKKRERDRKRGLYSPLAGPFPKLMIRSLRRVVAGWWKRMAWVEVVGEVPEKCRRGSDRARK